MLRARLSKQNVLGAFFRCWFLKEPNLGPEETYTPLWVQWENYHIHMNILTK